MQLDPSDVLYLVLTRSAVFGDKMRLSPGGVRKARSTGMGRGTGGHGQRKETAALQKQEHP